MEADLETQPATLSAASGLLQRLDGRGRRRSACRRSDEELHWWASALSGPAPSIATTCCTSPPGRRFPRCQHRVAFWIHLWKQDAPLRELHRTLARLDNVVALCDVAILPESLLPLLDRLLANLNGRAANGANDIRRQTGLSSCVGRSSNPRSVPPARIKDCWSNSRSSARNWRTWISRSCSTGRESVRDRLQRRRPALRQQLLRSAGVGGAPGELRRDRPGPGRPGALVRPGPHAHHDRRANRRC